MNDQVEVNRNDYIQFVKADNGFPGYLAKAVIDDFKAEIEVWQVTGWDELGNTYIEKEKYLDAYIKWDGCSTIHFQEGLHLCGKWDYEQHCRLMIELFNYASENIKSFDSETAQ